MIDEPCLGPPRPHFPAWVKTPQDALDYLTYAALRVGPAVNYVRLRERGYCGPAQVFDERHLNEIIWSARSIKLIGHDGSVVEIGVHGDKRTLPVEVFEA